MTEDIHQRKITRLAYAGEAGNWELLRGLPHPALNPYVIDYSGYRETGGKPVWRRLQPLLNRLLPIQSVPACVGVGMLWGWLPCGLVYSASLYALSSGSAWQGGLSMAAFGLGTLPNLLAMGLFASRLKGWLQRRSVRLVAGLSVLTVDEALRLQALLQQQTAKTEQKK